MSKVIVLGGCGAVGRVAVKALAASGEFESVAIGEIDLDRARSLARDIGSSIVQAVEIDVSQADALRNVLSGYSVVLNCTGPFYRFAKPVVEAAIAVRANVVDVCDDVDATVELLALDASAREAGVHVLIGMGSSPGVTNVLARFAADHLLDETHSVDIYHAHGGEPIEGEGVIAHRFHCMTIDVPVYLDGELKTVGFFDPDGIALREKVDFHRLGGDIEVYPYPHPEQLTLPQHIQLRRVTNKGTVLPDEYYRLIMDVCRLGLTGSEPLRVRGTDVSPHDFAIAFLLRERDRILRASDFGSQRGCVKVVVEGRKANRGRKIVFSMASENQALGEGTGLPAALGTILMAQGKVRGPGVFPPEAGVNPVDLLVLVQPMLKLIQPGGSFEGFLVESIDEDGKTERINLGG